LHLGIFEQPEKQSLFQQPLTFEKPHSSASKRLSMIQFSLLFRTIVLFSSGIGGGTGAPAISITARNLGGQTSRQVPHFMHFSWSMTWIWFLALIIASTGHLLAQVIQAWHFSGSI
jgi:hypothetical protein